MTDTEEVVQPQAHCPVFVAQSMADAVETLRSKTIVSSDILFSGAYKEQSAEEMVEAQECLKEHIGGGLVWSRGREHSSRRKLLNQLVRPAALDEFRDQVLVPEASRMMPRFVQGPDENGNYRLELVSFCDKVFIVFSAKMMGFVGLDTDEQVERLRECVFTLSTAATSAFFKDRAGINADARIAKKRYVEEFYNPSLAAAKAVLADIEAGNRPADSMPQNFMSWVASGAHPSYEDEHQAILESTVLFGATVATSTQSMVHAVNDLSAWFEDHPEDYARRTDHVFMLNALQESLRLWAPFTPFVTRMATEDMTVGGEPLNKGQVVHVPIPKANRDRAVWGADSATFNPWREVPDNVQRYGIAFGVGEHLCLGLRLVVGSDGTGGSHIRLLEKLFAVGVRPDPANPPQILARPEDLDDYVEKIPRYITYPTILADYKAPTT